MTLMQIKRRPALRSAPSLVDQDQRAVEVRQSSEARKGEVPYISGYRSRVADVFDTGPRPIASSQGSHARAAPGQPRGTAVPPYQQLTSLLFTCSSQRQQRASQAWRAAVRTSYHWAEATTTNRIRPSPFLIHNPQSAFSMRQQSSALACRSRTSRLGLDFFNQVTGVVEDAESRHQRLAYAQLFGRSGCPQCVPLEIGQ